MRREGNYLMLCTIEELAKVLARSVCYTDITNSSSFRTCDFCIVDGEDLDRDLEDIRRDASGWYGIKATDTGFNSEDLNLICDYYGGGCAHLISLWQGMNGYTEAAVEIQRMLLNMLNIQEAATDKSMVIVEFMDDEAMKERRKNVI